MNDTIRIKQILRANNLHAGDCAQRREKQARAEVDLLHLNPLPECDCWLSEDLFDLEADPPHMVESFQTADTYPRAVRSRRHRYADGRTRSWVSRRGGPWEEQT